MKLNGLIIIMICMISCKRDFEAPVPDLSWGEFDSASINPLPHGAMKKMEGVYTINEGSDVFGPLAVLKWSYTKTPGNDTVFHLSIFTEKDVSYFITEARKKDSAILLNGYWRKLDNTETGKVRLRIEGSSGAEHLLSSEPVTTANQVIVSGLFGEGEEMPFKTLKLSYLRPLNIIPPYEIIAHRGGGRNADLLPASENSVEMLLMAARFGATGVEIDVRLTKDGVPILYHDETLNERSIQKNGMLGPIENFTYEQLSAVVRLKRGGMIPTLREGLQTILESTPIRFVWLDLKYKGSLQIVRDMQQEFLQKAANMGKPLEIYMGIPDEDVYNNFLQLPGYQNIPSLVELEIEKVVGANAKIWAPMFTKGLQNEEVMTVQGQGRRAFVWTVDGANNVRKFMYEGRFNGILSNQPSIVAYYYYAK
jgi:glycerophosphoryl diester phosphodiesterase